MKLKLMSGLFLSAMIAGCATVPYQPYARQVKKQPLTGGVIALKEQHRPEDRAQADTLMSANCGAKQVQVTDEGEVVTGSATSSDARKTNEMQGEGGMQFGAFTFGGAEKDAEKTSLSSTTTALKEWQIQYTCVANEAPAKPTAKPAVKSAARTTSTRN